MLIFFFIDRLSRSVNYETREMYRFKNVDGKIIVIVDSDESMSPNFATTMIQRGYDNVFVLSGGLRVAKIKVGLPFNLNNYFSLYVCLFFFGCVGHTFGFLVVSQNVNNKSFLVCIKSEKYALKKILESPPGFLRPQASPEGLDSARAAGTF